MKFPSELKYSKEHTWIKTDGEIGTIGITEFAQSELDEIVFVDLPVFGKSFAKDEVFGSVEAVKTTSDLFMPVGGEVIKVNASLKDHADLVNTDPYIKGWMIKVRLTNASEINSLLTADAYQGMVGSK